MTLLTHQNAVHASYLLGAVTLITMPDMVGGLIMGILHLSMEFFHIAFEFLEMSLDHVVEHLFETGVHQTQVIVFYTIVAMGAVAGYFIWRGLCQLWHSLKIAATVGYVEKKSQANLYWHQQSVMGKIKLVTVASTGLAIIVLFGF